MLSCGVSLFFRLSVCLSVRLSRSWIMSERTNISWNFFHHRVATPDKTSCNTCIVQQTLNRGAGCSMRSGSSSALLVPTTRRRTLGDRAFAVAGSRVWNSLPATLTSQPSLLMFRRQLKTLLFEQSFSWLFISSVLLDTTFSRLVFFVTVTCPCSSTTKCHVNLFVYNNDNNNNTSTTLQNSIARLVSDSWAPCFLPETDVYLFFFFKNNSMCFIF